MSFFLCVILLACEIDISFADPETLCVRHAYATQKAAGESVYINGEYTLEPDLKKNNASVWKQVITPSPMSDECHSGSKYISAKHSLNSDLRWMVHSDPDPPYNIGGVECAEESLPSNPSECAKWSRFETITSTEELTAMKVSIGACPALDCAVLKLSGTDQVGDSTCEQSFTPYTANSSYGAPIQNVFEHVSSNHTVYFFFNPYQILWICAARNESTGAAAPWNDCSIHHTDAYLVQDKGFDGFDMLWLTSRSNQSSAKFPIGGDEYKFDATVECIGYPTLDPTIDPTRTPSAAPIESSSPTTRVPSKVSKNPSINPTTPSQSPIKASIYSTLGPTIDPTRTPSPGPSAAPIKSSISNYTTRATSNPSTNPTLDPTINPTRSTSAAPIESSIDPTRSLSTTSKVPSIHPTLTVTETTVETLMGSTERSVVETEQTSSSTSRAVLYGERVEDVSRTEARSRVYTSVGGEPQEDDDGAVFVIVTVILVGSVFCVICAVCCFVMWKVHTEALKAALDTGNLEATVDTVESSHRSSHTKALKAAVDTPKYPKRRSTGLEDISNPGAQAVRCSVYSEGGDGVAEESQDPRETGGERGYRESLGNTGAAPVILVTPTTPVEVVPLAHATERNDVGEKLELANIESVEGFEDDPFESGYRATSPRSSDRLR